MPLSLRLALSNIRKGIKSFAPFLLASLTMFVLIFVTAAIAFSKSIAQLPAGAGAVSTLMGFALVILAIFGTIIIVYSYRFLQLQRSREFGLYHILGFGKTKVVAVAFFELLLSYLIVFIFGTLIGMAFAKFLFLIYVNLIGGSVFNLAINPVTIGLLAALFFMIFVLLLLVASLIIWKSSSLDLLRENSKGEKEPRSNILFALLGLVLIAIGYVIALRVENPVQALMNFFLAVLVVILGTYFFYISSTVWYLKWRKRRPSYYKSHNFITISSLLYRMKANAVGLGNITILLSMAVVTIVTTVGLYFGTAQLVQQNFPQEGQILVLKENNVSRAELIASVEKISEEASVKISNINPVRTVAPLYANFSGQQLDFVKENQKYNRSLTLTSLVDVRATGNKVPELAENQILIYDSNAKNSYPAELKIAGKSYQVKTQLRQLQHFPFGSGLGDDLLIVFSNDTAVDSVLAGYKSIRNSDSEIILPQLSANFDISSKDEKTLIDFSGDKSSGPIRIGNKLVNFKSKALEGQRQSIGGFVFIGFVLGISFILGAALIIYYKQLSEGMQDKRSFKILQEVGLSKVEVQKTIRSQVRMIFFLPIVVTIIHFGFAYNMVSKIEQAFGIQEALLMMAISGGTILAVAVLYWGIYKLTSQVYYRIVER